MAYLSTLGSPGVEVHEKDASLRISQSSGTTIFIPGYASQGPVEEVNTITSIQDFENIYGVPTNAAESYFYYTVLAVLENAGNSANVLACRLPYGENEGDNVTTAFSMLIYPTIPVYRKRGCEHYYPFYELKDAITVSQIKLFGEEALITENSKNYKAIYIASEELNVNGTEETQINSSAQKIKKLQLILNSDYQSGIIKVKTNTSNTTNNTNTLTLTLHHYKDETDANAVKDAETTIADVSSTEAQKTEAEAIITKKATVLTTTIETDHVKIVKNIVNNKTIYTLKYGAVVECKNEKVGILVMDIDIESQSDIGFGGNIKSHITTDNAPDANNQALCSIPFGQIVSNENDKSVNIENFKTLDIDKFNTYLNGDYVIEDNTVNSGEESLFDNVTYLIGRPVSYQVSYKEYYDLITNETLKWSTESSGIVSMPTDKADILKLINGAAFIVFNTSRAIINENFEGFYLGITDNIFNEPNDNRIYNAITGVKTTTKTSDVDGSDNDVVPIAFENFFNLPDVQLDFYSRSNNTGSLSQVIQTGCTSFDTTTEEFDDTLSMILFKLNKSTTSNSALKLSYSIREKYNASLGKSRVQGSSSGTKPISYFIENVTKDSSNLMVLVNPTISSILKNDMNGNLTGKIRIAGDKLQEGLKAAEDEYLINAMSINSNTTKNKKMDPADVAQNCLKNYEAVCMRAGMNLETYETIMKITEPTIFGALNDIYPLGVYTVSKATNKIIGKTPYKLRRALTLIENDEEYPDIDILVNAGLSTIYAYTNGPKVVGDGDDNYTIIDETNDGLTIDEGEVKSGIFNDAAVLQGIEDLRTARTSITDDAQKIIDSFMAVDKEFMQIANSYTQGGRNDTFYINDTLRGILIKGKNTKIEKLYGTSLTNNVYSDTDKVNHSWSTSIYWPHKHLYDNITSSYTSAYAQWFKINDHYSDDSIWVPASGYIAAMMASTDAAYGPWYAVGGLRRGIVPGVLDCAISPTTKQRSDLYKICINSIPKLTGYGPTVWGIRTLSKVASAMDQNTCRRTILQIIKTVKRYLRYYVFEPNNSFTRLACYNDIDPYLADQVAKGSIYGYRLIVDTSNNTPEVINNGEMAVDISVQPTRTAENIVLTVTANKYTADITTTTFNAD